MFTAIQSNNQIAFSVIDLRLTELWWREGLGFLPAGGNRLLFRGPLIQRTVDLPGAAMSCWCMVARNDWSPTEFTASAHTAGRLRLYQRLKITRG